MWLRYIVVAVLTAQRIRWCDRTQRWRMPSRYIVVRHIGQRRTIRRIQAETVSGEERWIGTARCDVLLIQQCNWPWHVVGIFGADTLRRRTAPWPRWIIVDLQRRLWYIVCLVLWHCWQILIWALVAIWRRWQKIVQIDVTTSEWCYNLNWKSREEREKYVVRLSAIWTHHKLQQQQLNYILLLNINKLYENQPFYSLYEKQSRLCKSDVNRTELISSCLQA